MSGLEGWAGEEVVEAASSTQQMPGAPCPLCPPISFSSFHHGPEGSDQRGLERAPAMLQLSGCGTRCEHVTDRTAMRA